MLTQDSSSQPVNLFPSIYIIIEDDGIISYSSPEWENQLNTDSPISSIIPKVGDNFLQVCKAYMGSATVEAVQAVFSGELPNYKGQCRFESDAEVYQVGFQIYCIQKRPRKFLLVHHHSSGSSTVFENYYMNIIENLPQMLAVFDPAGYVLEYNQKLRDFLSALKIDIDGKRVVDLVAGVNRRALLEAMVELRRTGMLKERVFTMRREDGSEILLRVKGTTEVDQQGNILYGTLIFEDITEVTRTLKHLERTENVANKVIEEAPIGILTIDRDMQIVYENPTMMQMMGTPEGKSSQVVGKPIVEILEVNTPELTQTLKEIRNGKTITGEIIQYQSIFGNKLYIELYARSLWDAHGNWDGAVILSTDITERIKTENTLRRQLDTLKILHAVSSTCAAATSEDQIIEAVTDLIGESFYPDHFGVLLYDESNDQLKTHSSYRGIEKFDTEEVTIPRDLGIVWQVFNRREPKRIGKISEEPAYYESTSGVLSELCVPIQVEDHVLGVINAESKIESFFTDDDEMLLLTLAGQLGITIDRIRKQAAEREQRVVAEVIQNIARSLSASLDFETLIDRIFDAVEQLVPHDASGIFLFEGDEFYVLQQRGYEEYGSSEWVNTSRFQIDSLPTVKRLVETQQPVLIRNVDEAEFWVHLPETQWIKSYVEVPVWVGEDIIGYLSLHSTTSNFFTTEHVKRLETLTDHISVALANSNLYQQAVKSANRLTTLHEASHRVVAASRNPDQVYAAIHQAVDRLLPCDAFVMSMDTDDIDTVKLVYAYEEGEYHQPALLSAANSLSGRVIRMGETVHIRDQQSLESPVGKKLSNTSDQRSILAVPVRIEDRILGMLSVQSLQPNVYDEEDQYLLEMFATLAAASLENAGLIEETTRNLRYLEITNRITQIGLELRSMSELIESIAHSLVELLDADECYVSLWDETLGAPVPVSASGPYNQRYAKLRHEPDEPTLTKAVLETGSPIAVEDVFDSPHISPRIAAIFPSKSLLGLPLIVDEQKFGAVLVAYNDYHHFSEEEIRQASSAASQISLAIARIQLLEESQQHTRELQNLYETTTDLAGIQNLPNLLLTTIERASSLLKVQYGAILLLDSQRNDLVLTMSIDGIPPIGSRFPLGESLADEEPDFAHSFNVESYYQWENRIEDFDEYGITSVLEVPMSYAGELLGVLAVFEVAPKIRHFSNSDENLLSLFAGQVAGAVHSARLFEQTNQRLQELEAISSISTTLRTVDTLDALMPELQNQTMQLLDAQSVLLAMGSSEDDPLIVISAAGMWEKAKGVVIAQDMQDVDKIFTIAKSFDFENIKNVPLFNEQPWMGEVNTIAGVPLISQGRVFGILAVGRTNSPDGYAITFNQDDLRLLKAIGDISANAIRRTDFHQQTQLHLQRFTALHEIERAISASFDLNLTLEILLGRLTTQLEVDAASVLLLNESVFELTHAASRGFKTNLIHQTAVRLGEGPAGTAALERKVISMPDLENHHQFIRRELLAVEEFKAYYGIPLIAKGQVKGVLEIFHRNPLTHDPNWEDFMMTLATQAAIAIDNSALFSEVTRSNLELTLAYDATIEGWSAALELRDMETEGHSQRVTELTVTLARQMGVDEEDIVHVRRGALLHDIGKMGIPDSILHKPGPLDDKEWEIMRQHPIYAYNLLSRIDYLQPALDIPLSHHEKWDGTGYPHGISGEKIPLPARVFAIVDVWDALSHDRPYRGAWEHPRVMDYIEEQSGVHFDPHVVEKFTEIIEVYDHRE